MREDDFAAGFILGLLVGEGHFGGDGRRPHVMLRMHVRHEEMFRWLVEAVPGSRLYGPYYHGGRSYYQWVARGEALRRLVELIERFPLQKLDSYTASRYEKMKRDYGLA